MNVDESRPKSRGVHQLVARPEHGVAGVEAGKGSDPRPRIMVHIDKGGNRAATKAFFKPCLAFLRERTIAGSMAVFNYRLGDIEKFFSYYDELPKEIKKTPRR